MSLKTSTRRPLRIGFALTPLFAAMAFICLHLAVCLPTGCTWIEELTPGAAAVVGVVSVPLGYLAMLFLGSPWITLLARSGKLYVRQVCVAASICGVVVSVMFAKCIHSTSEIPDDDLVIWLAFGVVLGLLSGLTFCALVGVPWRRKR